MSNVIEKTPSPSTPPSGRVGGVLEKSDSHGEKGPVATDRPLDVEIEHDFNMTDEDYAEAKAVAGNMTLDEVRALMTNVHKIHHRDPNFPMPIIEKIEEFLGNEDVFENPEKHEDLIYEMKLEAAIITNNSPYAEVRAVVSNHDDPTLPCSTIRAWVIGIFFAGALGFINQFFDPRQPAIYVQANVAQLLAYPCGKFFEKVLPDWGFTLFGTRHSLNPGPFNKKEHMLITIMANVGFHAPYTANIIWVQKLPNYYNQAWAGSFSYQILLALGTNFIGYGMAGIARRFLVYPSYCVWPASLVTIALNQSFHNDNNSPVKGWFNKMYSMSRYTFFLVAFGAMFVYYWFPYYIFPVLSIFSWMTWIAPDNLNLNIITGFNNGLGLNPLSTFDWNTLMAYDNTDPLMVPFFSTANKVLGMVLTMPVLAAIWYTNTWNTGYLPINSNRVYDNTGALYNVSRATDAQGMLDVEKYQSYSPAYMSAGNLLLYIFFFAVYTATLTYIVLNHWFEVKMGFKSLISSFRKKDQDQTGQYQDVHNRLMQRYKEVPEWWYGICLLVAIAFGVAGVAAYPTNTSPGVVFYGLVLCLIFIVPVGIVKSMTGIEVTLNVLAEFIGGAWVEGNATSLNFFKSFGYVTCAHAIWFTNDLKMAHYIKIPPRQTFWAQMIATLVSTLVCTAILNFQMSLPNICTVDAPFRFTCPGINTFFTASVMWGTIGPSRVFGAGAPYTATLIGWPLGIVIAGGIYYIQRRFPKNAVLRQIHPVVMVYGPINWAPYNLSYFLPALPVGYLSWVYTKKRYLAFWAKYNFVLSAAWSVAIAICALICFFALQYNGIEMPEWWGNTAQSQGCEDTPCTLLKLGEGEFFGPGVGEFR